MRFKHLCNVILIFTLLLSSTAPIKAQGPGYAKWLMAGIGCLAATAFSYSWLKTGYWGYKISQELPKTKNARAMSLTDAAGHLHLIKALPELHTQDGVKTFVWGHRIQQKLKDAGIVLALGNNQANYLRLLHALHLRNQKLRETDNTIKELPAESEDQFIVWIYQLQQKIKAQSDATTSPMTFDEQVNSVMLLHKLPHLHNEHGMHTILFALRVQNELNQRAIAYKEQHAFSSSERFTFKKLPTMPDADKMYYLNFLHKLIQEVPAIVHYYEDQEAWMQTLVWAHKLQKELNEQQKKEGIAGKQLSIQEKIDYVKMLHTMPEIQTDEGIQEILKLYPLKTMISQEKILQLKQSVSNKWSTFKDTRTALWQTILLGNDAINLDF